MDRNENCSAYNIKLGEDKYKKIKLYVKTVTRKRKEKTKK